MRLIGQALDHDMAHLFSTPTCWPPPLGRETLAVCYTFGGQGVSDASKVGVGVGFPSRSACVACGVLCFQFHKRPHRACTHELPTAELASATQQHEHCRGRFCGYGSENEHHRNVADASSPFHCLSSCIARETREPRVILRKGLWVTVEQLFDRIRIRRLVSVACCASLHSAHGFSFEKDKP